MMLYYVTTNLGKVRTTRSILEKHGIQVIHEPMDLPEPRSDDVEKIAIEKVLHAHNKLKKPVIAVDAGFYIKSLNGFPKAFVNFALETIGIDGILKLVENKSRECEFHHSLAYMDNFLKKPKTFTDLVAGEVAEKPRGTIQPYHWSALSLIFVPGDSEKTLGEMTEQEFHAWRKESRKKNYLNEFAEWLKNR